MIQDALNRKLWQQLSARTPFMEAWYIQRLDAKAHLPISQIQIDILEIEIVKGRREETELLGKIGPDSQDGAIDKIKVRS
ncbi:MAG TPA: hypothetical protein VGW39_11125, partial [Chthoniobacterales bacterium]|nr:hypothetical protein [Chthoniobacterales bacterium]